MTIFRCVAGGPGPAGDVWSASLHVDSAQTISTVMAAFNTFASTFLGGAVKSVWPTVVSCTSLVVTQLDPITGKNVLQASMPVSIVGTDAGAALPQRAAMVIGLRTALPTRAGRGRFYLPAPSIAHLDADGLFASVPRGTIANAAAAALDTLNATAQAVIYHRATKTSTAVNAVTVGQVLGDQRRRTNKIAANYVQAPV